MQHLCLEVSPKSLRFSIFNLEDKFVQKNGELTLSGRVSELKKEACSDFLRSEELLDFDGEVSLSYAGQKVTLVPQAIFGESSAKEIFNLCFDQSAEQIEHNRFYEQTMVVVYEIESWIKRFFVLRYPRIIIQHEVTHLLRGIFKEPSFDAKLHLIPSDSFFTLILTSKNKIDFFNTFDFTNAEDLFYYVNYAWTNTFSKDKKVVLSWHSDSENDVLFHQFYSLFEKQFVAETFIIKRTSKIIHQLLCV